MSSFDKREEGFEKKFAHDEELKFKAEARRAKLLGIWAAGKLGISGADADAYAKSVVAADSDKNVAIADTEIRAMMDQLLSQAVAEIKAGK